MSSDRLFRKPKNKGPVFTQAERAEAGYGTQRRRVGTEALRPVDHCSLCLSLAKEPVVCPDGHLFCNECVLTNLLEQKNDIMQRTMEWERHESLKAAEADAAAESAAQEKV
eukprot:CAMPEP_0198328068 /NCGR_PEP_ID=MMETSP1450-20131203/15199_1 /TAXON_ID=753684 ORGANISM="Madagascaria erythrocladiodes, Strain CCMP3234" /NCGR_SAMPLE_ID=MMETSP1450 /ASSEMBLY_ACC=CAM_ASM_001115 /LENGTH=110 /DNA_ID=CAMNT_0044032157 /DNA_START=88 /DNA_END=417 /DNA_ORIENTATION=-